MQKSIIAEGDTRTDTKGGCGRIQMDGAGGGRSVHRRGTGNFIGEGRAGQNESGHHGDFHGNAIAEYRMEKRDIIPGFPDIKSTYDKLSVIVIGLCNREKPSNELTGMLNVLLSPDIPAQDKKKQLAEKYDMKMEDYDFEKLYEAVVKNPVYAHVTREEVRRLYEK